VSNRRNRTQTALAILVLALLLVAAGRHWQLYRTDARIRDGLADLADETVIANLEHLLRTGLPLEDRLQAMDRAQDRVIAAERALIAYAHLLPEKSVDTWLRPGSPPPARRQLHALRHGVVECYRPLTMIKGRISCYDSCLPDVDRRFLTLLISELRAAEDAFARSRRSNWQALVEEAEMCGEQLKLLSVNYADYAFAGLDRPDEEPPVDRSRAVETAEAAVRAWIESMGLDDVDRSGSDPLEGAPARATLEGNYWRGVRYWRVRVGPARVDVDAESGRILALAAVPEFVQGFGGEARAGSIDSPREAEERALDLLAGFVSPPCRIPFADPELVLETDFIEAFERETPEGRVVALAQEQPGWWPDGLSVPCVVDTWYVMVRPVVDGVTVRADTIELWVAAEDGSLLGFSAYHWGSEVDKSNILALRDALDLFNSRNPGHDLFSTDAELAVVWSDYAHRPVVAYVVPQREDGLRYYLVNAETGGLEGFRTARYGAR